MSKACIKILFLAANPKDTNRLRLDEEIRSIDFALRQSEYRHKFELLQHWAVRATDIQSYFLRHNPEIIHFSGHGSPANEIILEGISGESSPVPVHTLEQLFAVLTDHIRCVVLNACYSEQQAYAIAKHVDCVIGMSRAIGDSAAIAFSTAFYQALGYGKSITTAFESGRLQIDLEKLDEQDTPKLIALRTDPQKVVLVSEGSGKKETPKTVSSINLELVDVSFIQSDDFPKLDIKLRNIGKKIAFLKRVDFNVHKVWWIRAPNGILGVVESSATYDIVLPPAEGPYTKSLDLSHAIRPNDVDRFFIAMNVDGDHIYLISIALIFDGDDKSLTSKQLLLFVRRPTSTYSLPDYSHRSRRNNSVELKDVAWIFHNKKVLNEVSKIPAKKNQELLHLESFISRCLPYLEDKLTRFKKRLISLTDGKGSSFAEIEYLLDPELSIVIEESGIKASRMTDEALSHLKPLTRLQELDLSHSDKVTDEGLVQIKCLGNLKNLDLSWTTITDAGLENLRGLENLESIGLRGTRVGNAGLSHLKALKKLRKLTLWDTQITDAGLIHLRDLKQMVEMDFLRVSITSAGLEHLETLINLEVLSLSYTNVGDAGLAHLKKLSMLKRLDLTHTQITDAGLAYLSHSERLESLDVSGTRVTSAGLMHLKSLKKLKVRLKSERYEWTSIKDLL